MLSYPRRAGSALAWQGAARGGVAGGTPAKAPRPSQVEVPPTNRTKRLCVTDWPPKQHGPLSNMAP